MMGCCQPCSDGPGRRTRLAAWWIDGVPMCDEHAQETVGDDEFDLMMACLHGECRDPECCAPERALVDVDTKGRT